MLPCYPWQLTSQFLLAIKSNDANLVRDLVLDCGMDVDLRFQPSNCPAVCLCVELGHIETLRTLIKLGCSVNQGDREGYTPLHLAVRNGRLDIVDILLDERAALNALSDLGVSSLHLAVERKNLRLTEKLVNAGALVDTRGDVRLNSPLFLSFTVGASDVANFLLHSNAKITCTDSLGNCLMHLAANVSIKTIGELLSIAQRKGLDSWLLNKRNKYGRSPLHEFAQGNLASNRNAFDVTRFIAANFSSFWNPDSRDLQHRTPLIVAIIISYPEFARLLVTELGADVTLRDKLGVTPLRCALRYGNGTLEYGLVDLLIAAGALTYAPDRALILHPTANENYISPDVLLRLQSFARQPLSLADQCRIMIRTILRGRFRFAVDSLPVPASLKNFLIFSN